MYMKREEVSRRAHYNKKHQTKVDTNKKNEVNVVMYTDAVIGDAGTAIEWCYESTGQEKDSMLRGLRNIKTAEFLAIRNTVKSNLAVMEGKEKLYIFTDSMDVVRNCKNSRLGEAAW